MGVGVFLYWTAIAAILLILLFLIGILLLYAISTHSNPPFIPAPYAVLPQIYKALDIKDGSAVYDLGCGDCRIIVQCYTRNPRAKYVGVEKNFLPHALSRIRLRNFMKNGNIKLIRQNFFDTDLSGADRIYIYLLPNVIEAISEKFKKELRPGTRVVSLDFQLKKEPAQVIDLQRPFNVLGQKIYIYEF